MADEYVINVRDFAWERRPDGFVYVGRPSKWGNPFTHHSEARATLATHFVASRAEAIERYEEWIRSKPELLACLDELRGKVLGCYCAPLPCHADVILKILRETEPRNG